VILSGGLDSTTLVYDLVHDGYDVQALSFNYGQKHVKEVDYALTTAVRLGLQHFTLNVSGISQLIRSALTTVSMDVPNGHYTDASMRRTIVPNRNAIMLSIAYGHAVSIGADIVATAVHAGDHAIYPDCRLNFIHALTAAFMTGNQSSITIYTPYIGMTKSDIVKRGEQLEVPWDDTWSCYNGRELHCGTCGTCVERREAFELANVQDTTGYETEQERTL